MSIVGHFKLFFRIAFSGIFLFSYCGKISEPSGKNTPEKFIYRVEIREAITPSSEEILESAIEKSEKDGASALLVVFDSPGGLMQSMDDMVRKILSSKVPVIAYVYPPGSSCGSACVFILYASHISAMSEATNIGSATPVTMGGGPSDEKEKNPSGPIPDKAGTDDSVNMKRKILNHAKAHIRSIAEYRKRNVSFAEQTITRAENVTSTEALKIHAIDFIAYSPEELLQKTEGQKVRMLAGEETLHLKGLKIISLEEQIRSKILSLISNPALAYIIMMIGILGIFTEIQYPGLVFPGVIGSICLLLGLYAQQTLSVDFTGYGLIFLGILFLILEIKIVSFGLLSVAGILCLILGSLMMVKTDAGFTSQSVAIVLATSSIIGVTMAFLVYKSAQVMRKKPVSGAEQLLNEEGIVVEPIDQIQGRIRIHGELWTARSKNGPIEIGDKVKIISRDGMILSVEKNI